MSRHGARDSTAMVEDYGGASDGDTDRTAAARPAPKRAAAARDPTSLQAVAKRRAFVRLADADEDADDDAGSRSRSGAYGSGDDDDDNDDDDCFAIRSSLRVELEHERRKPRERLPGNCWWLNCATSGGGSSAAARHGAPAGQAGTPYMTRRTKEVRVKAVLGDRVVRMIVQGSNVREGVKQMEGAGMLCPDGCHADTRYQMLAFE